MKKMIELSQELEDRIKKMVKLLEQLEVEISGDDYKKATVEQLNEIESSIAMTICSNYRSDRIYELMRQNKDFDWLKAEEAFNKSM
jgi:hypothetical protein